jgi:CheY-like chemotaxis protein
MSARNITVVLGEDDDGHALLIRRNLDRVGFGDHFVRKRDGREVLDYFDPSQARAAERPHVLLLDINMPRLDGITVLQRLKEDPGTARLPVIMLTTTDDPDDVQRCYDLGCNVYVTKPVVYEHFVEAVSRLGALLAVAKVPTHVSHRR